MLETAARAGCAAAVAGGPDLFEFLRGVAAFRCHRGQELGEIPPTAAARAVIQGIVAVRIAGEFGVAAALFLGRLLFQPGQAHEAEPVTIGQPGDGGRQLHGLTAAAVLLLGRALGGDEGEELRRLGGQLHHQGMAGHQLVA